MMKKRIIAFPIIAISLLISCNARQLRSDIANFIASFSIERSMETYLEAQYTKNSEQLIDGVKTVAHETFYFNVKDEENISYERHSRITKDEEIISENNEQIVKEDGTYYYLSGEYKIEKTIRECFDIINKFFYTGESDIGSKSNGMYYGDLIHEIVYDVQDFVTIQEEKYVYKVVQNLANNGMTGQIKIAYTVNSLGMLENYDYEGITGENSIKTTILVEKY